MMNLSGLASTFRALTTLYLQSLSRNFSCGVEHQDLAGSPKVRVYTLFFSGYHARLGLPLGSSIVGVYPLQLMQLQDYSGGN